MNVYLRPIDARVMVPGFVAWRRGGVSRLFAIAILTGVVALMALDWHVGISAWLLSAAANAFAWPWLPPKRRRMG